MWFQAPVGRPAAVIADEVRGALAENPQLASPEPESVEPGTPSNSVPVVAEAPEALVGGAIGTDNSPDPSSWTVGFLITALLLLIGLVLVPVVDWILQLTRRAMPPADSVRSGQTPL